MQALKTVTMLEVALSCIRRGWYVFPCIPKTKQPLGGLVPRGWKDATKDETTVRRWWAAKPDANVAIACNPSKLCVVDIDHGLLDKAALADWSQCSGIPETYTVRTGRRPELGVQMYFEGAIPDVGLFEHLGCSGQIKSLGGYVMAAGSIHPSGEAYTPLRDVAVHPLVGVVRGFSNGRQSAPTEDSEPITKDRNIRLTSIAGKLRNAGLSADAIEAALLQTNEDRCQPPLHEDEVKRIAANAGSWKLPEEDPAVVLGGTAKQGGRAIDETEDVELETEGSRPRYPDEVWAGTPYGDFADLCSANNFVPKKFFSESIRTVVGAIVGDRLSSPVYGANPRSYTIKIGPPGSGKGTSHEWAELVFSGERWEGLVRTESPLLWKDENEIAWRSRGLGAMMVSPASAPGLINSIGSRKLRKDETANPMEQWQPMPRLITMAEEVISLFANFANESTGSNLEAVLCELYDRGSFTATATKDRKPVSGRLMYSLLGGITKDGWDSVFSKTQSTESGFMSRLNIIGTEESRTVGTVRKPDLTPIQNRLFPLIQYLEKQPVSLDCASDADALVGAWFSSLRTSEGVSKARLNIHAWRTALHLAWLRGHTAITKADAEDGIKVAEYQIRMREHYAPPQGETRVARCEAVIRRMMRSKKRVKLRELKKGTNGDKYGVGLWDRALQDLVKAGELRIAEEAQPSGRKAKMVILLKYKD